MGVAHTCNPSHCHGRDQEDSMCLEASLGGEGGVKETPHPPKAGHGDVPPVIPGTGRRMVI
jgi:hypothetical protein